ncbi:hypothetical protein J6S55_00125 [Candidatus Saccharibacteria bacterium]|nr:hypothetical protein [Candidatus Saccharibacteria bacterium]
MKNIANTIKQKLASYIYIYIYRSRLNSLNSYIKNSRNLRVVGISASVTLAAFMTLAAFPITLKGNVAEAMTGNPASTILTMTSASASANLDLVVRNANGTFSTSPDLNSARFSITTDNYTGYKLLIAGTNDTRELVNSASGTALESITTAMDAGLFGGDTATSLNGKWGYKPSKLNSTTNTNFLPAPTTSNLDTLDITNSANSTANNYIIALGARADYSTIPGTYTNTFVLTAVANNIPYTINFNDNTEDSTVANLPATISGDTISTSVALPTTIPTRTGYTFAGWCDTVTTINANGTTACSGTVYPASTTTTTSYLDFIDQTVSSNIANLYTMWNVNTYDITVNITGAGISSITFAPNETEYPTITIVASNSTANLVYGVNYTVIANLTNTDDYEFDSWALNNSNYGTLSSTTTNPTTFTPNQNSGNAVITALGKTNAYDRLVSGELTVQDIGKLSSAGQNALFARMTTGTAYDAKDIRDNDTYKIAKLADGNIWFLDNLRLGDSNAITLTSSDTNITSSFTLPASIGYSDKFNSYTSPIIYNKRENYTHYTEAANVGNGSHKSGVYYNFCAASGGTYCYAQDSGEHGDATYDICPKGWRMAGKTEFMGANIAYELDGTKTVTALSLPPSKYTVYANADSSWTAGSYLNTSDYGSFFWTPNLLVGDIDSSTYRGNSMLMLYTNYNYQDESFRYIANGTDGNSWNIRASGIPMRCVLNAKPQTMTSIAYTYMQDITSDKISSYQNGSTAILKDKRDNQEYSVAKIGGRLWMTTNLNIAGGTTLKPVTSNVTSNYTLPASSTSGFSDDTTAYVYNSNNSNCNNGDPCYSYYSFYAAVVGTMGNSETGDASQDICPKGWKIPTSTEYGSLKDMYYTAEKIAAEPFNATYAGRYTSSGYSNNTSGQYFSSSKWSSGSGTNSVGVLSFNSSGNTVSVSNGAGRRTGLPIRCVTK